MTTEKDTEKLIKRFYKRKSSEIRTENERRTIDDALMVFEDTKHNREFVFANVLIKIAAVIIIFISVFLVFHFHRNNTSQLLNAVVAKIESADTLIYKVKTNSQLPNYTASQTKWTLTKSGYVQIDADNGCFSIILEANKTKGVVIMPQEKRTFAIELPNIQTRNSQIPFLIVSKLRSLSSQKVELLGKKEINNKITEGFGLSENNCVTKIWIESTSLLPVRFEMQFVNQPNMNITASDFKINTFVEKPSLDDYEKMPIRLNAEPWMANEFYLNEFLASLIELQKEVDVFQSINNRRGFTEMAIQFGQKNNCAALANCEFEFVH